MNLKRPRFIFISALAMLLLVGCVQAGQPPVDIDATVEASLEQALTIVPTPTAVPKWT
jgi:outer membrane biogenesis lipoprotein LolB